MGVKKVNIKINGNEYVAKAEKNLLHTCLSLGFDIPYFCFHPALGSVGACRLCAVKKHKDENDRVGRIIMSCMEPVSEGLIISTDDPDVRKFRAAIIESLMSNHPHDCPVCDEGGECHLQDMTVMTGHTYRKFAFRKRTYKNQYLGPHIQHEMNRCIQCYRCVRFYRDYAGGKDLNVFGASNRIYFGRHKEGRLESDFSGNLVEVCPTGVFTDKTLRDHYTRKWDLTNAPSVCRNCSLGCNIIISERYGMIRRIMSRYNGAVNGYFICDRGRFGYDYVNGQGRVKKILGKIPGKKIREEVLPADFTSMIKTLIKNRRLAGIGSPSATLESNFALENLVGKENFYHGISDKEYSLTRTAIRILLSGAAHSASMKDVENADVILILGENIPETAPMLALTVRQAARNRSFEMAERSGIPVWNDAAVRELGQEAGSPVFIATPGNTDIDDLSSSKLILSYAEIAQVGREAARRIENNPSYKDDLDKRLRLISEDIASALIAAERPVIITGLQCNDPEVLNAAGDIIKALSVTGKVPGLSIVFPECNSLGLGMLAGKQLSELEGEVGSGTVDTLIILENDLFRRIDAQRAETLINGVRHVIILSPVINEVTARADIVLPSGTFAESTGTIVNNEGRAQTSFRVLPDDGHVMDSWKFIAEMIRVTKVRDRLPWKDYNELVSTFTAEYPFFSGIKGTMNDVRSRIPREKIPRQTMRFSGRTAINAGIEVSESGPPKDEDSPLNFSMEGFKGMPPSELVPYYWSAGWNSVQAMNSYMDEPSGDVAGGNPGVLLFK